MNTLKFRLIACCVLAVCSAPIAVFADTFTITDYSQDANSYWGGLVTSSITGNIYPAYAYDTVGGNDYDVDTLTVTRSGDSFTAVLAGQYFSSTNAEFVGDLFLTTTGWNPAQTDPSDTHYSTDNVLTTGTTWDYVLRIIGGNVLPGGDVTGGTIGLYAIDPTTGQIVLAQDTVQESGVYRADQAVQYDTDAQALALGTWALDATTGTFTFSLDDVDLAALGLDGQIGLHWTMSCGNDVIEGVVPATASLPEPATMLLLGAGLSGLAAYRRRMSVKK